MAFIELRSVTKSYRKGEHAVTPLDEQSPWIIPYRFRNSCMMAISWAC